jgi:hypothetical protein
MSLNEFDKLLKERFDEHEFAYNDANWDRLVGQLPEKSHKTIPFPWLKATGIAAALAVTVGGMSYFLSKDTAAPIVQNTTHTPLPLEQVVAPSTNPTVIAQNNQSPVAASDAIYLKEKKNLSTQATKIESDNAIANTVQLATNRPASIETSTVTTKSQADIAKEEINTDEQKKAISASLAFNNEVSFEPKVVKDNKTFVSLTGGMNFGSMNAGYMAGINAKQKLSKKIFLEGDLAIVGNTASQTFTKQQIPVNTGGGSLRGAAIDYKNANLVYIQVNPTVGYQLMKKVSVGVGADLQQMVNGSNALVNVNDETKTIPASDFGLTGKTEIALSPKIKAGILYREGINNLINGSSDYFDRSYLQVQLKWTVLHK